MYSSGKDVLVNLCRHSGHSHCYYSSSRAYLLRFPVTLALSGQDVGKGTVGSCLKALQLAADGRSDLPEAVGLSRVHSGKPFSSRMLQTAPCSGTVLQGFQGFGSLLGRQRWPRCNTQCCCCSQISLRLILGWVGECGDVLLYYSTEKRRHSHRKLCFILSLEVQPNKVSVSPQSSQTPCFPRDMFIKKMGVWLIPRNP